VKSPAVNKRYGLIVPVETKLADHGASFVVVVNVSTGESANELAGFVVRFTGLEVPISDGPVVSPHTDSIQRHVPESAWRLTHSSAISRDENTPLGNVGW